MADIPGGASGLLCRDYKGKEADRLVTQALGRQNGHADAYGIKITRTIQIPDVGEYSRGPPLISQTMKGWGVLRALRPVYAIRSI